MQVLDSVMRIGKGLLERLTHQSFLRGLLTAEMELIAKINIEKSSVDEELVPTVKVEKPPVDKGELVMQVTQTATLFMRDYVLGALADKDALDQEMILQNVESWFGRVLPTLFSGAAGT